MIKAVNLTKRFDGFPALDGLSTEIQQGSIYGLVGPNGSGKSTLLRLIAGVYAPDNGAIWLDGLPIFENPLAKEQVFYLPDDLYFLPKTTVREMAAFYRGMYPGFDQEKFNRLSQIFPLDVDKKIATFSKGMRRQAALLLALCCGVHCLLLDEAFDGLDPVIRLVVKKLLAEEMSIRKMIVVITSHNLRELEDLCDHVGLLHKGKILFEKELDELRLGFCKVQAVFDRPVDWEKTNLEILQRQQRGSFVSLLVRGDPESSLATLQKLSPKFSEAVPLTLEEVFIGEMEAVGYDCNNILL